MPEPMTPEREAKIREHLAYASAGDSTLGDIYARDLLAELDATRDALRLAESDGDSARRDLTGAYTVLTDAMPGRPATATAAAEKAVRMIRDHDAERRRALDERDEARAEVRRLRAALGGEVRRNSIPGPPSGAPDSVVRAWAREHGFPVKPKGRVAPDARAAYEAAWRAEQNGDETNG